MGRSPSTRARPSVPRWWREIHEGTDPVNTQRLTLRAGGIQGATGGRSRSASRTGVGGRMSCQHMGCGCQAEPGQEFCGDYCREHSGDAAHEEHMCECGHDACTMAAV
jgi:hypothetical protein